MPVNLGIAAHTFLSVLVLGTLWRVVSYHLMASSNPQVVHLGAAMSTQY